MKNRGITAWFKSLYNFPAKWRRRTKTERALLMEAFVMLGLARMALLILPFRWLAVSLGRHMNEADAQMSASDLSLARKVGQAVCSTANNTPWKSACLPQAVVAQWMLKRRNITGTLYLGVAKDDAKPEKLVAHAWLRCGNVILTGREGYRQFTIVGAFGTSKSGKKGIIH